MTDKEHQSSIPGIEAFYTESDTEEDFYEGAPHGSAYFDAASLPDAPDYQPAAHGVDVFKLYVLFPTQDDMKEGIALLTGGNRKGLSRVARMATVKSTKLMEDGSTLLDYWRARLGDSAPEEKAPAPKVAKTPAGSKPASKPAQSKLEPLPAIAPVTGFVPVEVDSEEVAFAFPTYKRVGIVKTFDHFPAKEVTAFVEPQEYKLYRAIYPNQRFIQYPESGWTITRKRQYIVEQSNKFHIRYLFMLEDDLTGFYQRDGVTAGGSPKLTKVQWDVVCNAMLRTMQRWQLAELGLSQQQSNHYYEEEELKFACKITEFCLLDLQRLSELDVEYDTALKQFEDFDLTIQILEAGGRAALYTPAAFGHVEMGKNKGGHQADGKRVAETKEAVAEMARKYPNYVTVKEGRLFPEPKIDWSKLRRMMK